MDWGLAVKRNQEALLRIVVALVAMLPDEGVVTLPRSVHSFILAILRPAESAVRRLIVVAARGVTVAPRARRAPPAGVIPSGCGADMPAFPLFDSRKCADPRDPKVPGFGPNVRDFDGGGTAPPAPNEPMPDDPVDATRLVRRLRAVHGALNDLPLQARRLVRMLSGGKAKFLRPMRPGRPPGHVSRGKREIDELLAECQELALMALNDPKKVPP